MLKRNKVLVAFMLSAVLCMSISFAAISDALMGVATGVTATIHDDADSDTRQPPLLFYKAIAVGMID